ncbi:MAG: hypothetical protein PHR15_00945 [Atopobiaceae bacterium]|jgi:hypothetical protein|nr:hypothetical protein [Atopobiaceae bacterium]MCH4180022.1 hypothetical protein [Atopobiaceae bacterium]MCH4213926.1 hypothetical protein [Atopobiaceae bacterium]MCH4229824.1 hypothetical protein [Atopobiaceae bacterium]MCH4275611.1 hypothetical protein [Atopobiaceae bacterium]
MPSGGHAASTALRLLAVVLRVSGILISALVVLLGLSPRVSTLLSSVGGIISMIPAGVSGILVYETPFEGIFRGDLAIVAAGLLVLDWILTKASTSLR